MSLKAVAILVLNLQRTGIGYFDDARVILEGSAKIRSRA
jgi:hypothetical protein